MAGFLRTNRSRLLKPLTHYHMLHTSSSTKPGRTRSGSTYTKLNINIVPSISRPSTASRPRASTSGAVRPSRAARSTLLPMVSPSGGRTVAGLSPRRLVGWSVLVSVYVCIAGAPALVSSFMLSASSLSLDSSYFRSPTLV